MGDLKLINALVQDMAYREQRQKVLAQNIANADTPGYRPQDVVIPDFKDLLESSSSSLSLSAGVGVTRTDNSHFGVNGIATPDQAKSKIQKQVYEVAPAGNAVVLEEQLLKANENFAAHRFSSTLYQKQLDMLNMAAQDRR